MEKLVPKGIGAHKENPEILEFVGIRVHRGPKVYMVIQELLDIREIKDLKGIKETEDKMAMTVQWAILAIEDLWDQLGPQALEDPEDAE